MLSDITAIGPKPSNDYFLFLLAEKKGLTLWASSSPGPTATMRTASESINPKTGTFTSIGPEWRICRRRELPVNRVPQLAQPQGTSGPGAVVSRPHHKKRTVGKARVCQLVAVPPRLQWRDDRRAGQYQIRAWGYENAPVGLRIFDEQLRYLRINRHLAETNGLPIEDHIGCTVHQVVPDLGDQAESCNNRFCARASRWTTSN